MITKVLTKFRIGTYGVTADIRRAFLQIGLRPQDRDFLRFLWLEGAEPDKIKTYRHKRVVFGVNASPFLLAATLNYHLDSVPSHYKDTARKLKEALYVDNCIASVNTVDELKKFIDESTEILSSAKFLLRDWNHNVLSPLSNQNPEPTPSHLDSARVVNVLGMRWDLTRDTFMLDIKDEINLTPSKRNVLSILHKLYDPLGLVSPITLIPKQILQNCWRKKLSWDETLPPDLGKVFNRWATQINHLRNVEVPRKLPTLDHNTTLHVFCDASKVAYATCIFLRHDDGTTVECKLVQSRVRVAPVKPLTIPRLEILSCTIGSRLAKTIKDDLGLEGIKSYYWCDSLNALYWIKREENWATFILNRVSEIRKISDPSDWRHIPGRLNPADLPSRGCYPRDLEKTQWWLGPTWLYRPPEEWPEMSENDFDPEIIEAERRKTVVSAHNAVGKREGDIFDKLSDYYLILKVVCWMFRFVRNVRLAPPLRIKTAITTEELKQAELRVCKYVQKQSFKNIDDKSIRVLRPFLDPTGIIRIKSRIIRRDDEGDFRTPILLPSDHPLVEKLIRREHENMGHAGTQFVVNSLRERFWILRSRKIVRKIIRRCVRCRRFDAPTGEVPQAPLPEDRIRDAGVFEIVGVDLTGPLYLRGGQKAWIVLFTCAVYRAVHLELTNNLSTADFLRSLKRFIARRGRPSIIYSDNGKNFVGANNLLRDINWETLTNKTNELQIVWKFIPPSSPWWGGWWERLIGVLKRVLRKVLGKSSLDYERLLTVVCDIEAVMNDRPLTSLSEDPNDLAALTPALFLREPKTAGVPDLDHIDSNTFKKKLLYISKLKCDLRKRFRSEYLGQLRQNSKFIKNPTSLKVGDIVIVSTPQKRVNWPLAKIVEVLPSADGYARTVKLKTAAGEICRTVQQLVPLEADCNNHSDDFKRRLRSFGTLRPQGGSVAKTSQKNA